jgi:penicillin-binding protein 1C
MLSLDRGVLSKLHATLFALRLEAHLDKDEILTEYLNRAPYGNQRYGAGAAAKLYFQKLPSQLTLAESALLAGLPQSPTTFDPLTRLENARKRQREVLRRMRANGFISEKELQDALLQELDFAKVKKTFLAPHFVDYALKTATDTLDAQTLITTLDYELQRQCEALARGHLARLKKNRVTNAALAVMDNHSGEILAMVGSADYFDADIDGQ